MEGAQAFSLEAIMPPNPVTKRAFRVKWSMKPNTEGQQIVAYATGKNLVIRDLTDARKSVIYNRNVIHEITCVKYNHNGYYVAYGDEKGGVRIIGWSAAENNFVTHYENEGLLGGAAVNDIAFSDDNNKIAVVGAGGTRAKSINIENNSGCGEITGHTATILSADIKTTRPFRMVLTGEDKEI